MLNQTVVDVHQCAHVGLATVAVDGELLVVDVKYQVAAGVSGLVPMPVLCKDQSGRSFKYYLCLERSHTIDTHARRCLHRTWFREPGGRMQYA